MRFVRCVEATLAVLMLGIVTGTLLDMAFWSWRWPYLGVDWLAYVCQADGESAYDRMWYSLVVQWIVIWSFASIALRIFIHRRERASSLQAAK